MKIIEAHKFSFKHRDSILKSKLCGCFHCLKIFSPRIIDTWLDENKNNGGQTAECPYCGMDSVIGDYDILFNKGFLEEMKKHWFNLS